ncbi:MAG TPA: rhodanese-like domain-containing protein [Phycisphaerales bacterium]|nr:rhodanese-like domain-containing protein [Phycisphaerales bacterium]
MHVRGPLGAFLLAGSLWALSGCETSTSDKDLAKESVLVSLADVRQMMSDRDAGEEHALLLIDPRAPKYFAEGHLPGARNLRLPDVREDQPRDPALERYARLVVYGENPGSAVAKAMFKRLLAVGYSGIRFFPGGLAEWRSSGYEAETSEPPAAQDGADTEAGS